MKTKKIASPGAAVLLVLALLLAACGSDNAGPPAGSAADPIVVQYSDDISYVAYTGTVGTNQIYFKAVGMNPSSDCTIELIDLTDYVAFHVYSDVFVTELCGSLSSTGAMCTMQANSSGELYIMVDGSPSAAGTGFSLKVHRPEYLLE